MIKKISMIGVCLILFVFFLIITPKIHHQIRLEESSVVPRVTTTEEIKAVPDGNVKTLLNEENSATIIFLNAKNTKLNQEFDAFVNAHPDFGLKKPIYIFQELYHDKDVSKLNLDQKVINVVTFNNGQKLSIFKITEKTAFNQQLITKIQQLAAK